MKILYINPFDSSGYGQAGLRYVKSLEAAGVDVVARRLNLGGQPISPEILAPYERKSTEGVTHCIQHTLPTHYQYCADYKQIGLFALETIQCPPEWIRRLKWMDHVVHICRDQRAAFDGDDWLPSSVIPHACDPSLYEMVCPLYADLIPYAERGTYIFYGIGEWNRRKDWASLLRAYYGEFDRSENVLLVIKTSGITKQKAEDFAKDVYVGMKLRPVGCRPPVLFITDFLEEDKLMSLHQSCHCYVSSSHGEAWNIPCMDAMGFGNPVIVPQVGGFVDYVTPECGKLVHVICEPCFGAVDGVPEAYRAHDLWARINIYKLGDHMRELASNWELSRKLGRNGAARVHDFSYEKVGLQFAEVLRGI